MAYSYFITRDSLFEFISIESQIDIFQSEYYKVIADCHVNGHSNLFIEFMLRQIDTILDEIIIQIRRSDDK